MYRPVLELPPPNAVVAGQPSTFRLPTDVRYHNVTLEYKTNANQATIEAAIDLIELKVKGRVRRSFTPAQLFAINAEMGYAFEAGQIPFYFSEKNARTGVDEDILAWGMADVNDFEIVVHVASGATTPSLAGWAEVDEVQEPFVGVVEWYSNQVPVSATGIKKFNPTMDKKKELVKALHLFEAANDDITRIRVALDRVEQFNLTTTRNALLLAREGFTAQSGCKSWRPDRQRRLENYLPMIKASGGEVNEFLVEATMANASSFNYILQVFSAQPN